MKKFLPNIKSFTERSINVTKLAIAAYLAKNANYGIFGSYESNSKKNDFRVPFRKYIQSNPLRKYFTKSDLRKTALMVQLYTDRSYSPEGLDILIPECLDNLQNPQTSHVSDKLITYDVHHLIGAQHIFLLPDSKLSQLVNSYYRYISDHFYIGVSMKTAHLLSKMRIIYWNYLTNPIPDVQKKIIQKIKKMNQAKKLPSPIGK